MLDAQLRHLGDILSNKRIWAVNVGENFRITGRAWESFTRALSTTAVAYLYVSEQHLRGTDMKIRMRDAIRINRRCASARENLSCLAGLTECSAGAQFPAGQVRRGMQK